QSNRTRTLLIGLVVVIALAVVTALWFSRSATTRQPPTATAAPAATNTAEPVHTDTPIPTDTPAPVEEEAPAAASAEEAAPAAEEEAAYPAPDEEEAYPAPAAADTAPAEEGAYPPPQVTSSSAEEEAYPAPSAPTEETSRIPIVPFAIEQPVTAGSTVIRGTGPAGVPILVVNVTYMGEILGEGVIGADGTFEISTTALEAETWVGVSLADLTGSDFAYEDFYASGFRGEGAAQVPQVGFVYDSVTVGG
ncbi:MAG: hypothetical protein QM346_07655, partial [Chloroflexota bacterium]|nr:hypothetical protein [Chloroflexota bacterium]